ncbi:hypothetical protein Pint_29305 [Pistacia integerrima]|uniref:Uncharacterized protein n=1 Tax=Pistacia integerrima TaxID=434235 RepID=A0ACC0X0X6_9ROSI|nr:hypothetical protein Pint_29305 [Pistacia integerrima]
MEQQIHWQIFRWPYSSWDYIGQFANLSVDSSINLQPGADLTNGANFASAAGLVF